MPGDAEHIAFAWIEQTIRFVFSWVILMPIAVIITGKLLAKPIQLSVNSKQIFKLPLKILVIQATGSEVVLGFTGFIICLLLLGLLFGNQAYLVVKTNFGIDPGQFDALCILSSLISVGLSFIIFLLHNFLSKRLASSFLSDPKHYDELIERLSKKTKDN